MINGNTKKPDNKFSDISNKVVSIIDNGELKMKSRWSFWAGKVGFKGGFAFILLILAFLVNLVLYYFHSTGLLYYFSFNASSMLFIFKNMPFYYLLFGLVILALIVLLLKNTNLIYNKNYRSWKLAIIFIIILSGVGIFYSGINGNIEKAVASSDKKLFLLSEIYKGKLKCLPNSKNGIVGKVINKKGGNILVVETLDKNKTFAVKADPETINTIDNGTIIIAIGKQNNEVFVARFIKPATKEMVIKCFNRI